MTRQKKIKQRVILVGPGRLGQSLLRGWVSQSTIPSRSLVAVARRLQLAKSISKQFGVSCLTSLPRTTSNDILILCMKPYHFADWILQNRQSIHPNTLVISMMAGLLPSRIAKTHEVRNPIILAMTNTATSVNQAMTVLFSHRCKKSHRQITMRLFKDLGQVTESHERFLPSWTALVGSAPAFVLSLIESLQQSALQDGLPLKQSTYAIAQSFLGAAVLAQAYPDQISHLISHIATPGGCTEAGLRAMKTTRSSQSLQRGYLACRNRAKTLARSK